MWTCPVLQDTRFLQVHAAWRHNRNPFRRSRWWVVHILREPQENPKVKDDRKISILWRIELNNLLKVNGLPRYPQKSKFFVQQALLERVDHDLLWKQVCNELFERDYNTIEETIEEYRKSKRK